MDAMLRQLRMRLAISAALAAGWGGLARDGLLAATIFAMVMLVTASKEAEPLSRKIVPASLMAAIMALGFLYIRLGPHPPH